MSTDRWTELVSLFERALDWPEDERDRLLLEATDGDEDRGRRVGAMLRADTRRHPVFDSSPRDLADAISDPAGPAAPALEGRRFGPYVVLHEIARGGMG